MSYYVVAPAYFSPVWFGLIELIAKFCPESMCATWNSATVSSWECLTMKLMWHVLKFIKKWTGFFLGFFFFLKEVFFMWMLPMIIFPYLASAIIQAKHQVLRNGTTHVSKIFNLLVIFSVSFRSSAPSAANWHWWQTWASSVCLWEVSSHVSSRAALHV